MRSLTGTRFGRYEVLELIGARARGRRPEIVTGGQTLHLQPGQEEPFTVTATRRGIFEYYVKVLLAEDSTTRAQGGSNPRIIIT